MWTITQGKSFPGEMVQLEAFAKNYCVSLRITQISPFAIIIEKVLHIPSCHLTAAPLDCSHYRTDRGSGRLLDDALTDPGSDRLLDDSRTDPGSDRLLDDSRTDPGSDRLLDDSRTDPGSDRLLDDSRTDPGSDRLLDDSRTDPGPGRLLLDVF